MRPSAGALFGSLGELFGRAYEAAYTLRLDEPAEIVNWKVEAAGPAPDLGSGYALSGPAGTAKALKGARLAYDPTPRAMTEWPVYDRYALSPGASITGPALIEERESTCVIGARARGERRCPLQSRRGPRSMIARTNAMSERPSTPSASASCGTASSPSSTRSSRRWCAPRSPPSSTRATTSPAWCSTRRPTRSPRAPSACRCSSAARPSRCATC